MRSLRGLVVAVCDRRRPMHKRISCASTLIERRYNAVSSAATLIERRTILEIVPPISF
jgi:hypothetical protein